VKTYTFVIVRGDDIFTVSANMNEMGGKGYDLQQLIPIPSGGWVAVMRMEKGAADAAKA
jgi:hypothetical protein